MLSTASLMLHDRMSKVISRTSVRRLMVTAEPISWPTWLGVNCTMAPGTRVPRPMSFFSFCLPRTITSCNCSSRGEVWALLLAVVMARSSRVRIVMNVLFILVTILEYVARLAVEGFTNGIERREADGTGLARLQYGEVGGGDAHLLGQFARGHLALGQHYVYVYYD